MKKILLILITLAMTATVYSQEKEIQSKGLAVLSAEGNFQPYSFTRRVMGDNDILMEILYAGICHTDIHHAHSDWGHEDYPMVPGHEIAGRVVAVGKNVTRFKVGDYAGVGCIADACGECEPCKEDMEMYCKDVVWSYHDKDHFHDNIPMQGGYSNNYVVKEKFAVNIPANAQIEKVAPLLCAGVTTYSPIRYVGVKRGDKVGVAGFGGLGHMAVQYAVSLGADVTVFDITEEKRADAARLGATNYVNVTNPKEPEGLNNQFDFILSTITAKYDPVMYVKMLKLEGKFCFVGAPANKDNAGVDDLTLVYSPHRMVFGSQIGGMKETQEMLDYSVEHNIYPEVEIIKADAAEIDKAFKRVQSGDVKFRFVIDMMTLK